jgi:O-antigen/teichoic acid export membrane protein
MPAAAPPDVERRAARGALIGLLGSTPANLLSVLVTVVCARWLSPESFGAYSLAAAIFGISDVLTNPAVTTYLLTKPGCADKVVDAAWTLSVLRGLALSAGFALLAPLAASALGGTPQTATLLRVLALRFALSGLSNLHTVRLQHDLRYGLVVAMESGAAMVGSSLSVGLLVLTRDPLSLAVGVVGSALVSAAVSWWLAPVRARFVLDRSDLSEMWHFTRYVSINGVIIYALLNLDDLIVARLAGAAALGVYALSYRVVNAAVLFLIQPLGQVLLPTLSKVRDDVPRFGKAFLRAVSAFACVSWLVTAICATLTTELFAMLAPGSSWGEAVPIFRALLPFVLVRGINGAMGAMLTAVGRPDLLTRISGSQLLLMVPCAWLGFSLYGFVGLTVALSVLNACALLALVVIAPRLAAVSRVSLVAMILLPLPAAGVSAVLGGRLRELSSSAIVAGPLALLAMGACFVLVWELCVLALRARLPEALSLLGLLSRLRAPRVGADASS